MKQRVLVVDDEESLLDLLQRYLVRIGYEVETAPSAEQALERVSGGAQYNLFIVDLSLPGMSGDDLATHILAAEPSARILLVSGHAFDTERLPAETRAHVAFLQKPFLPRQLAGVLNDLTGLAT